ncbi:MAG: hypothetical protein OXK80_01255 [Bdellovibrionales bacterium]|nr:hypothetical protein [Bdellovibrionales bacterium]
MKFFIFILLMFNTWVFADTIDDQVDALQAHMQKALDVKNLNEENIQQKMQEMSESLSDADLSHLTEPITEPPEGMSNEDFRKMKADVDQTLKNNGVTKEDLDQLKREISDLTQSQ